MCNRTTNTDFWQKAVCENFTTKELKDETLMTFSVFLFPFVFVFFCFELIPVYSVLNPFFFLFSFFFIVIVFVLFWDFQQSL